jgi:glycosyltransferase involved in cell wall biosynthesis
MPRLAILTSHPIQYYGPLFRELAKRIDLHVFFAHQATPQEQARAGFGTAFKWDVDITSGYSHSFLRNVARHAGTGHFLGSDTPEIGERLRAGKFDALLVTGWHLKAYLQGLFAARCSGIPVMVRGDSHLGTPRSRIKSSAKEFVYPRFLRMFDAALYVGERSRAYYQHYQVPPSKLFFSPHCVDTDWFAARATEAARQCLRERFRISADANVLLFAGKLLPFKRPLDVIAAAGLCRAGGRCVEVMVAGDGMLRHELAAAAASAGIPLHILGFCNQSEMPHVYAATDCLVLPSDGRETWGLVANEALACGRPIVVSDACGCAPDLAADGRAGLVFPTGEVSELDAALEKIFAAPRERAAIAAKATAYSLPVAADAILGACEFATGSRKSAA